MMDGAWLWSEEHRQLCKVIETQTLWGNTFHRIWLPNRETVVRVRADTLKPLSVAGITTPAGIAYIATSARIADALTQDVLLAPIESAVIPLPHQIKALSKAVSSNSVRYLLADEVGLGKTIEAGLIMRELKLRGMVRRILIVAPKGLVSQWVSEMRLHFNEEFQLILPEDIKTLQRLYSNPENQNPWSLFNQVVCPMDSVKPMDKRRGWTKEQLAEYNRDRFEDLIAAAWDLVIVDEAHRLGGSSDQVARYKLGQGLSEAAPYFLMLSATPHQGKTDAFYRLISLLDPVAFPDISSVTRERVQPYVIRTEKRRAINAQGEPLFKPRQTQLIPVSWSVKHRQHRQLYEAVTDYVREGYNQALKQKKSYVGFLMILMQRLVTSSTHAIRTTLERRLEVLREPEEQLTLFPMFAAEEWSEMDGQEQVDSLLTTRLKAFKNEKAEVELLLEAAKLTEAAGADPKAEELLDWIYRLQQEESDPDIKVLIFTEFVPTQKMLREFLTQRGISVVCLNGSMGMQERKQVQEAFAKDVRILISTDAGGEGLNLQFCHVVVNYDIPWNPMRLEQRIGRVDRIGQTFSVRALNFVFEDTVEYRVREVLEEKLAVILSEFGVDKTGDVLDSAQAGLIFDDLYIKTLINPESLDTKVQEVVSRVQQQLVVAKESTAIYQTNEELDPTAAQQLIDHPIPHWVERMTINYLRSHGGIAEKQGDIWNLTLPTGEQLKNTVFNATQATVTPNAQHLTLEDSQIRGMVMAKQVFAEGQPIPCISIPGLPGDVQGFWSLWRIAIYTEDWNQQRMMPLFLNDDGRVFLPTARYIWEQLLTEEVEIQKHLCGEEATKAFSIVWETALVQGKGIYEELLRKHHQQLEKEREKSMYAFAARRRAIERIGLPQVRDYRLTQLAQEEQTWHEAMQQKSEITPELIPLLLMRVENYS
ncbi:DEAD/DEAH box helicase [Nostoc sp. DedQUE09]|uniref:DEAD/DEAH box helicase n=1 Tax=Nostoc sp. DedQUE09 TaxID=3075394 RepID=UPI002AD40976|nr:helicase-related protein [Nostoc sp. DedQUE09]MDZ7954084.1 helicase-related protein [Nostoc sp. DedQUE09]